MSGKASSWTNAYTCMMVCRMKAEAKKKKKEEQADG